MGPKEVCAVCGVAAGLKCAGCKAVHYCGKQHQKAHWKTHSRACKAYKLEENEKLGRHYVAVRRIEVGEVVIREESALVLGPQQDSVPVCLGCGATLLQPEQVRPCPRCGWPLCSKCDGHGLECQFTERHRDSKVCIKEFGIAHPTYKCVSVVRALALKHAEPEAYAKLTGLASLHGQPEFDEPRNIAAFVVRFFNKLEDFTEDEVARVAAVLQINGHEVPTTEPPSIAVYDLSSYLEHSCRGNCSKSFTESGGIIIRAAARIEKGEHITICYTDPLWGTANRRHHLSRTKFFDCTCPRCSDPTEFGTMFNAIKCTSENCSGSMLPRTFLVAGSTGDYVCDKCGGSLGPGEVDELLERIGKELAFLKKNDAAACRGFIERHKRSLHENHFYMTDARLALAQLLGQDNEAGLPGLDNDLISEKILLCKKLDELLRVIVPAENRVRGLILFEMHAAVAEFGRRQDKDQLFNIIQESKRLLTEAIRLLKYEPETLPEGKIAKIALKNLRELEIIITKLCQNAVTPL